MSETKHESWRSYPRAQAIQDGALIDVSEMADEVGISAPTALTAGAWKRFVTVPDGVQGEDETARLWAVLNMFYFTLRRGLIGDTARFDVLLKSENTAPRPLAVKAVWGLGDAADNELTIMLPEEE